MDKLIITIEEKSPGKVLIQMQGKICPDALTRAFASLFRHDKKIKTLVGIAWLNSNKTDLQDGQIVFKQMDN